MRNGMKQGVALATVFALGLAAGAALAKKGVLSSALYAGKPAPEAGSALLVAARTIAGKGSWENIAVGRVHYLGGRKKDGQEAFDAVLGAPKAEAGDWMRVGRVYFEAGEREKAKAAFEKVLQLKPDDEDWQAEIGACYNLWGDRARAEELFGRSFARDPEDLDNALLAAGSYLGVKPRS